MSSFTETGLQENIIKAITELGFEKPTPIQAKTIPHLLSSEKDLIAFAQTGTGKTAAFGLPAIQLTDVKNKGTQTLILCPTRELAIQISKDLKNYSKYIKGFGVVPVYGGASIDTQVKALRNEAQIVVATPGRAKDLITRKRLNVSNVSRLILDEADEMLTMGFKEELNAILAETPDNKQTLLFSATMSKEIINITKKYMNDPVEIAAAQQNTVAENVKHLYYMVQAKNKYEVLKRISDINPQIYGIVFCRTRRETKEIANRLMTDGYNADALHGDLSQAQRDEVMGRFRKRQLQLLVATDVAARGIDVTDLTHIINFHLPDETEVYIHRSGRTGRAGKSGTSVAIIHTRESNRIRDIERKFKIKFIKESVPGGKEICSKQLLTLIDKIEKVKVDESQIEPYLPEIYKQLEGLSREELIKHFVSSEFNRFLEYYKYAKDINISDNYRERDSDDRNPRNKRDRKDGRERRDSRDSRDGRERRDSRDGRDGRERERRSDRPVRETNPNLTRLFINVGSKNDLNPPRLIGLINNALDSGDAEIGRIEILKKFSFFEIDKKVDAQLIKELSGKDFEGVSISVEISEEKKATPSTEGRSESSERRSSPRRSGGGSSRPRDGRRDSRERRSNNQGRRSSRD